MKYFICTEQQMEAYLKWKIGYNVISSVCGEVGIANFLQSNPCPIQAKEIPDNKKIMERFPESDKPEMNIKRTAARLAAKWMRDILIGSPGK